MFSALFLSPVLVPDLREGCYWLSAIIRYSRFIDNPPEKIFSLFGRLLGGRPDSSKSLRGCAFSLGYYHASTCAFSQPVQGLLIVNCASLRSLRTCYWRLLTVFNISENQPASKQRPTIKVRALLLATYFLSVLPVIVGLI